MSTYLSGLNINEVNYISASGPGVSRSVCIPKFKIQFEEDKKINNLYGSSKYNMLIKFPVEIKKLEPEMVSEIEKLVTAKKNFEEAQRKYESEKIDFFKTETGKWIESWLVPGGHPEITQEEAVKKVHDSKLFEKLNEIANVVKTDIKVRKGHNDSGDSINVTVDLKNKEKGLLNMFSKDELDSRDLPRKIGEFYFSSSHGDKKEMKVTYSWIYQDYPQYRSDDKKELKKMFHLRYEEKVTKLTKNISYYNNDIRIGQELKDEFSEQLKVAYSGENNNSD